jgi:hypothetical protein
MSDDEFSEEAEELIAEVVKNIEFKPNVSIHEVGGFIEFTIHVQTPRGVALISYKPRAAAEHILKVYEDRITEEYRDLFKEELAEGNYISPYSEIYAAAERAIRVLLTQLSSEFEDTINSLPVLAMKLNECIGQEEMVQSGAEREESEGVLMSVIDKHMNTLNEARRQRWINEIHRVIKESRDRLPAQYDELYSLAVIIKKHHDSELERYEANHKRDGFKHDEWKRIWIAQDKYSSSPSDIAYVCLAHEHGKGIEYMKKLVRQARKAQESGSKIKRTLIRRTNVRRKGASSTDIKTKS